jgi:OmpA-OmpF porin, OOP family
MNNWRGKIRMKISVKLTAGLLAIGLLAGCAGNSQTVNEKNTFCALVGGVAGGAAMGAAGSGPAAGAGAAVGALAALILCSEGDAAPEPMAAPQECADTPEPGALLDAQGCSFDSDGDAVVDGVDMCQNTPAGISVDRVGCALDADRDAVPYYLDLCQGTPKGHIVDTDGCSLPGQNLLTLRGINFATNKAVLTASSQSILSQAVVALQSNTAITVQIEGHTDSRGTEEYNAALSQRRAEAVVNYLVSQGIDGDRLVPVGKGEGYPVSSNLTPDGQFENRRVDFVVSH